MTVPQEAANQRVPHKAVKRSLRAALMLCVDSFRAHGIILVAAFAFVAASEWFLSDLTTRKTSALGFIFKLMFTNALPLAAIGLLVMRLLQYVVFVKPASPLRQLAIDIRAMFTNRGRLLNGLPIFVALLAENKAAMELKANIPAVVRFAWDERFLQLDRWLHLGVDPWRALQPVIGFPFVTFVISVGYNFWLLLLFWLWAWFGFAERFTELRTRFFVAFILTWMVGGGIAAAAFSSAGPVYYHLLGLGDDPYRPLFTYLSAVNEQLPIWALDVQKMLWEQYTADSPSFVGISAFPSMHNAMVALFALTFLHIDRRLGYVMIAYAFLILIGSVHLGWHYAVDGYAGIAIAIVCWWLAGKVAAWNQRQPWVAQHEANLVRLRSRTAGAVPTAS